MAPISVDQFMIKNIFINLFTLAVRITDIPIPDKFVSGYQVVDHLVLINQKLDQKFNFLQIYT
jgi:hypothetical protein